ncbi:nitroreductase [Gordonia humi]|uniref:Nitroreductase n=1 Tax=Gordonia humi TaxID=686429 RepID=A0A840EQ35_9ACTN|nr:nitroreductase [Gordonia humi]MBB4134945.1 nitroreductase [Gordonia humi]
MTNADHEVIARVLSDRYSCRAFLPDRVPAETLRTLFSGAQRTASWCNSQAWQVTLVSGDEAVSFGEDLTAWVAAGNPVVLDIDAPYRYEGVYAQRRRGAGFGLYEAVGIARDDVEGRARQMLKNFSFFGAPHVAVITSPKSLGPYGAVDCGAYVSTLLTVAQSLGLATVAQASIAMHSDFVRRRLDVAADRDVICAVSLGYPDTADPVNGFRTDRADIDDVVDGLPPLDR